MRRGTVRGGDGHLHEAAEVLSHDEWQRWTLGLPEHPERVPIDPATVGLVVELQRRAS